MKASSQGTSNRVRLCVDCWILEKLGRVGYTHASCEIMNWIYKKTENKSKGSKKNRTNTIEAVIFIHSCKLANEAEHKAVGQERFPDVGFHVFMLIVLSDSCNDANTITLSLQAKAKGFEWLVTGLEHH